MKSRFETNITCSDIYMENIYMEKELKWYVKDFTEVVLNNYSISIKLYFTFLPWLNVLDNNFILYPFLLKYSYFFQV